jgi:hypothetical protein
MLRVKHILAANINRAVTGEVLEHIVFHGQQPAGG